MPADRLDVHAVNFVGWFDTPESSDQIFVFLDSQVELSLLVVLELWVINCFLRNASTAPHPNTFNFETWLITEYQVSCETVLAEIVESLEETIAEIVGDVKLFTFSLVLVVVEEPK